MTFIEFLIATLYGIVEGITEWLPISSTGHMILLDQWLNVGSRFGDKFWQLFLVVIQLGAILAVVVLFWNKLWPFGNKTKEEKKNIWLTWRNVVIAIIPAVIFGLVYEHFDLDAKLNSFIIVGLMLVLYGIIFIILERYNKNRTFKITSVAYMSSKIALIIGFVQVLALIPGTSRSGVTILGAMLLACDRKTAAEFSFFLSIPVMFGASLLKSVKYFADGYTISAPQALFLITGMVVAFVISIIAIKFLLKYVNTHDFIIFGYYRIFLGLIVIILYFAYYMNHTNILIDLYNNFMGIIYGRI